MGVQASWNGYTWGYSPRRAAALDDLSTGHSLNIEQTQNKDGKTVQTTTFDLDTVTASFRASISAGVDPDAEYRRLYGMVGKYAPFYKAGAQWPPGKLMLLEDVSIGSVSMNGSGRIVDAVISLSWKEYRTAGGLVAQTGAAARLSPGVRAYSARSSALAIGQGVDRNSKKAVNGQMARW